VGAGTIVIRSASDDESDTGEIVVNDNVVELIDGTPTTGILLRKVVNCRVSGNRVRGSGADGSRGLDLTLSQACTVTDNVLLSVGIGCVSDGSNHLQFLGNYVFAPKTGFRAGVLTERKAWAHNNVYVNNRVLAGGQGFIVQGSGMILVGNYAAFLDPGPAIWVRKGGTHDAVVANNPSMAVAGGIRFDASDGVVAANVPISNGASGIEVRGERVAVTGNAITSCPTGIRLDPATRECTVVGNTVKNASEVPIAIAGVGHRVRDNVFADGAAPEVGPGAVYGTGTVAIESARTIVEGEFLNDRYLVSIEWAQDPGGREWIADKSSAGFVIVLPAAPPAPLSARWIARGY
jgi:hypothetical protein